MTKRPKWQNSIDFFFNIAAMTIGLGNIWRFPYLCYKNGGGVFLIPYILSVMLIGFPLFFLETSFGQYVGKGMTKAWAMIPLTKGIGFANAIITWYANSLYSVVLAWACKYFVDSFSAVLPWATCDNSWNTENCKEIQSVTQTQNESSVQDFTIELITNNQTNQRGHGVPAAVEYWERGVLGVSASIDDVGSMRWNIFLYFIALWIITYLCIFKGIKWSTKIVYVTASLPIVMLVVVLVRGLTLDGAWDGIVFYLKPDFSRLADAEVWKDAVTQVYYSYGIGSGALVTLASYNRFNHNMYRDSIMVALVNSGTSFLAGFAVFSTLGFMAKQQNVTIDVVAESGPGLVFIVYPQALSMLPLAQFWNALFFLMIVLLGFDCMFVFQECLVVSIMDMFPWWYTKRWGREIIQAIFVVLIVIMASSMLTEGGIYVFLLLNDYAGAGWCLFFIGTCEFIGIAWIYGNDRFWRHVQDMVQKPLWAPWITFCWKFAGPCTSMGILIYWLTLYEPLTYNRTYVYPVWAQALGWCLGLSSSLWIPGYAIYQLCQAARKSNASLRSILSAPDLEKQEEDWKAAEASSCDWKNKANQSIL